MRADVEHAGGCCADPVRAGSGHRAPARRRDEVEKVQRQLQVWTTMAWLDHADVQSDRLISVVMPTRNRSGWIGRAIASIRGTDVRALGPGRGGRRQQRRDCPGGG